MRFFLKTLAVLTVLGGAADAVAAAPQAIHLTKAAIRLKDGEVWGHWGSYLACSISIEELRWKADRNTFSPRRYSEVFDEVLISSGLKDSKSESLFDEAPTGGLQLGIVINHVDAQICSASLDDTAATRTFRGKAAMTAEWQVYDPTRAEVVARISTSATGEQPNRTRDGLEGVIMAAFRANAAQLVANEDFRKVLLNGAAPSSRMPPLAVRFTPAAASPRTIPAASMSVATVLTGDGWGSGFLISNEGHMLTNQHVVGDASQVRVRWADKSETVAQVVRTDRRRDVALLKVEAAQHAALSLRSAAVQPGDTVLAIGTPLDKQLQNTVTRGVVSGNRTIEGQTFVQSDVAVDHGNSGGPLLDDIGRVVAITDWGYAPDGVSHNLNFFIPIDDALKALALIPAG